MYLTRLITVASCHNIGSIMTCTKSGITKHALFSIIFKTFHFKKRMNNEYEKETVKLVKLEEINMTYSLNLLIWFDSGERRGGRKREIGDKKR